ncbi:hypothetical protein EVA_17188 [gut metagenome]|uniref:Uncharacterized protein n=1 Tax=gut metagenome TaxID=749906 RepID=J9C4H2_9ZZZZ
MRLSENRMRKGFLSRSVMIKLARSMVSIKSRVSMTARVRKLSGITLL